jgi:hypothetical protein
MLYKQLTAKRWAKEQGEKLWKAKFGCMAMAGICFKSGLMSAAEVLKKFEEFGITQQDRERFDRETGR